MFDSYHTHVCQVHHDRMRHEEVDRHFIKENIEKGIISISYVPTFEQVADLLTRGLVRPVLEKLVGKLGIFNIFQPSLRESVEELVQVRVRLFALNGSLNLNGSDLNPLSVFVFLFLFFKIYYLLIDLIRSGLVWSLNHSDFFY